MRIALSALQERVASRLERAGIPDAKEIAWACAWLEACGYAGLTMLLEALADERKEIDLVRDSLGIDLHNESCAFLAPGIARDVASRGRVFLRNVRHGLYILPFTVRANFGIGCPVDPSFAVGGERSKNPYTEKLEGAATEGLEVDEGLLCSLET